MTKKLNHLQFLVKSVPKGKSLYYLHATSYMHVRSTYKRKVGLSTNKDTINPHWYGLDCSRQYATSTEANEEYEIDFISLTKKTKKAKFVDPNTLKRRTDITNHESKNLLISTRDDLTSDVDNSQKVDLNPVISELIVPTAVELKAVTINESNLIDFVDENLLWLDRLIKYSPNLNDFVGDNLSKKLTNFSSLVSWSLNETENCKLRAFVLAIDHFFHENEANNQVLLEQFKISKAKSELLDLGLWKYLSFLQSQVNNPVNNQHIDEFTEGSQVPDVSTILDSIYQNWKRLSENSFNDGRFPIIPEDLAVSLFYLKQEQLNKILTSKLLFELEKPTALKQLLLLNKSKTAFLVSVYSKKDDFDVNFGTLLKPNVHSLIAVKKAAGISSFAGSSIEVIVTKLDIGLAMKFKNFVWKFAKKGYYLDSHLENIDDIIKSEYDSITYKQIPDDLDLFKFSSQLNLLKLYLATGLDPIGTEFSDWSPNQILNGLGRLISGLTGVPVTPFFDLQSKLKYLFDYNGGYTAVLDLLLTNEAVLSKLGSKSKTTADVDLKSLQSHIQKNISKYEIFVSYLTSSFSTNSMSSEKLYDALLEFKNLYTFGKIPRIGTDHYEEWDDVIDYLLKMCSLHDSVTEQLVGGFHSFKDKVRYYDEGLWKYVDEFKHLSSFINFKESKLSSIITAIKVEQVHLEKIIKRSFNDDWLYYAAKIRNEKYTNLIEFLNLREFINTLSLHEIACDNADEIYLKYYEGSAANGAFLKDLNLVSLLEKVPPRFSEYTVAALVELVNERGFAALNEDPFFSRACEGLLHDCYIPRIILDSCESIVTAPYVQIPDDINMDSFAPELRVLRDKLGTSFASSTPKQIYLSISDLIVRIAYEPKHLLEEKLFRMRKLERKICQLFAANNGNTRVLDLVILNHDAFSQFEQNLVTLKVPTKWNSSVIDALVEAGALKYLDELKGIHSRLPFWYSTREEIMGSLEDIKPLKAPDVGDIWSNDYSSTFFAKYLKLERLKSLREVLKSVDSWTSKDLIYFVQKDLEPTSLVLKTRVANTSLQIDDVVTELEEFKDIMNDSFKYENVSLPELLSLLFANRDRECAATLYRHFIYLIERDEIHSSVPIASDRYIEELARSVKKLKEKELSELVFRNEKSLKEEEEIVHIKPTAACEKSESVVEHSHDSYRQIPDEFRLEEFIPELNTLKSELKCARFEEVEPSRVLDTISSLAHQEENFGGALGNNYRKLQRNLGNLFKHNNGYTSVLDNVLKSQEVFSLFELSNSNNKIDVALANIQPSDLLVYDIITNQRDIVSRIYDINEWNSYSLQDFAAMESKSYKERLLFAVGQLRKQDLYLYPVTRDIVDKLLTLCSSIDGFPVFFHEIFSSEYQLSVEDVHKLLKSRGIRDTTSIVNAPIEPKTSYSDHVRVFSELTKKVNKADIAKLQERRSQLNENSRESLEVFLNKAKLHNDMAKQMKFREENAYEWSSSKLKSNRTLEGRNFFSPISRGPRRRRNGEKSEYLLCSSEGPNIISNDNPLGGFGQKLSDMVTVLSKFLKNDLPELIRVVKAHQRQNWTLIGGKSGENRMLVFERNKPRSLRVLRALKTGFAVTGFGFLILLGLNWFVEDQPVVESIIVKDFDKGVDEIRLLADVSVSTISNAIGCENEVAVVTEPASKEKAKSSWKSWLWRT